MARWWRTLAGLVSGDSEGSHATANGRRPLAGFHLPGIWHSDVLHHPANAKQLYADFEKTEEIIDWVRENHSENPHINKLLDELDNYFIDDTGEIVIGEIEIPNDLTETDVLNEIDGYILDVNSDIDLGDMNEFIE